MSAERRAQLLLPTPLGVVEYDVLEDTVFVGRGPRGGLTAAPVPFQTALLAITWGEGGFVVRSLPGESPPEVNGKEAEGATLAGGDRIGVADEVLAFQTAVPAATPPAAPAEPPPRRPTGQRRPPPVRMRSNPWVTVVALAGIGLGLFGLYRALGHLSGLRADERVEVYVPAAPEVPETRERSPDAAELAYREVLAWEAQNPEDFAGALSRYRDLHGRFPDRPEADLARAKIREIADAAAGDALAQLEKRLKSYLGDGRYAAALKAIRTYERKYGATPTGQAAHALRDSTQARARQALDALLAKVGPMVAEDPRAAHRLLLAAGRDFPPDLAGEVTQQMERALELMKTRGPTSRRPPRPPSPPSSRPPPGRPGEEAPPAPPTPAADAGEPAAREQWKDAYADLKAGRYEEALKGYALLTLRFGRTETVRQNRRAIAAGRRAAKVGHEGPAALVSVPVEEKRGRLTLEYGFDTAPEFEEDFTIEQPFPSDRPVRVKPDMGAIRMSDASGLFHVLVWDDDVRVEVRARAEVARDFGILAVAETDEFRAIMLNVNNTKFSLKKGAAARPNPGHLLWFMGQGVWADADADFIGYIKIAERPNSKIENGDQLTMEFVRDGDSCEGGFHGRTDGVSLRGKVRGDDGRSMGAARIGVFTNTGALTVESMTITGKVDMAWFRSHLALLVDHARGPEED